MREPLLHFLLLGALLFVVYGRVSESGFRGPDDILVTRQQVESLVMQFERVWQRRPTAQERDSLVESWIREEVFYREALAMGLEQDDPVVRRRMSQKLQFIVDSGSSAAPTEADLQRWLEEHADQYRLDPTYVVRQAYFDPSRHGDRTGTEIARARGELAAGRSAGDPTLLPAILEGSAHDVVQTFGEEFERSLRELPVGSWQGPVRSGFGLHLVRLERRSEGRPATLAEARTAVERDLAMARAQAASEAHYGRLRAKYEVRIEMPEPARPAG